MRPKTRFLDQVLHPRVQISREPQQVRFHD